MSTTSHSFARFMATPPGRLLRVVAGLALIAWGWTMREQTAGIVLMIVGLAPLLAGAFNVCLIASVIGAPFSGRDALRTRPGPDGPG